VRSKAEQPAEPSAWHTSETNKDKTKTKKRVV